MNAPRTKFYLDKLNAKWSGVCAGIADYTGIDVTVIRIGFVLSLFIPGLAGITIPGYFLTSWLAPRKPVELYQQDGDQKKFWQDVRRNPHRVTRDVRSRFRELDRRLADVETYVTSSNNRLANEIEQLR
jgi:phage shock protein C